MKHNGNGFTLVEVLIVVIVLGILAAIVVPQFTDASGDAKLSSLQTNLQTVRGQLELYKIQHIDATGTENYPTLANFTDQMTKASKADGSTADIGTSGYNLGPYLQSVPNNPYTSLNAIGSGAVGSSDWYYDEDTGVFRANHHADYTDY